MARKNIPNPFSNSPGKIYQGITTSSPDFSDESEGRIMIEKNPPFVDYCIKMGRKFPSFRKNAKFSNEHQQAVNFLGWRLNAGDFMAALKGSFLLYSIPITLIIILLFIFGVGFQVGAIDTAEYFGDPILFALAGFDTQVTMMFFGLICLILFGVLGIGLYMIYSFPLNAANEEKNKALTYVPEMVGYMIMSMKLVPNLEKAIEFSAKHGKGKVAVEFKRLIWDFQIGIHESIATGLDNLAYRWGDYSSELKQALMKIRASVMEPTESRRYELLDKTMLDVLESVKEKMEEYARSLNQPAVMLFYLGILLPLILIIILPVGSAFSNSPFANPLVLFIIYCVGIPIIAFSFAKSVVSKRPPTYEAPIINDDFVELPKKWSMEIGKGRMDVRFVAVIVLIVGVLLSAGLSLYGLPPKFLLISDEFGEPFQLLAPDKDFGDILVDQGYSRTEFGTPIIDLFFVQIGSDIKNGDMYKKMIDEGVPEDLAYNQASREYLMLTTNPSTDPTKYLFWSGIIITISVFVSLLLHYRNIYKRKAQLNIIKMEDEFKESMYVIASRMGENKPVENALKHAKEFLPNLLISTRVFGKTVENIELMGMPLDLAIFDPIYGSLKGIPSKVLNTSMQLLVDSVSLGVEVASRTLMSLSLQMDNMDKVNKSLKAMVSEVSSTMLMMSVFIGPIVLGITVALQKVVMMTLAGVVTDPAMDALNAGEIGGVAGGMGGMEMNQLFSLTIETFQQMASPLVFLLILAVYVAEIVVIMIYFTTKIQEDNDLLFKINLAKYLPIAMTIFAVTALGASMAITAML
ncbi:MAG: hypothetical protein PHX27_02890 [Candidatus ainarchaeum sp.]|nr:hypothetical protein [Candidatus ainarchaeum sp.]